MNCTNCLGSILRKQILGLCGLGLSLFVLTHVMGNFLIFVGPEAYNMYSHKLTSNPLIYIAEAGLLLIFFTHLGIALSLAWHNHRARPEKYAVASSGAKGTSFVQKTLWHQGVLIFAFCIYHLLTFKFGPGAEAGYTAEYDGVVVRDIYRLVIEIFQSPAYVGGYIFALLVLFGHLGHGVASALQTLGLHHPKFQPKIKCASWAYATFVSFGFISQPIYVYFFHAGS